MATTSPTKPPIRSLEAIARAMSTEAAPVCMRTLHRQLNSKKDHPIKRVIRRDGTRYVAHREDLEVYMASYPTVAEVEKSRTPKARKPRRRRKSH